MAAVACALLGSTATAAAEAPLPASCSLARCIEIARSRHPRLAANHARYRALRAREQVRASEHGPSVVLRAGPGYTIGESVSPFGVLGGRDLDENLGTSVDGFYHQTVVALDLPLIREGSRLGRPTDSERVARLQSEEQLVTLAALAQELAQAVADVYFEVLRARRSLPLLEEIVTVRIAAVQAAHAALGQELITRVGLLEAQTRLAQARRDLLLARTAARDGRRDLALAMGLERGTEIEPEELPETASRPHPLEPLLDRLEDAPDLRAAALNVEAKRQENARLRHAPWPAVNLAVSYGVADDFSPPINDRFQADLLVSLPLWDSRASHHRLLAGLAETDEALHELAALRLGLERQVRDLHRRVLESGAEQAILRTRRELAEAVAAERAGLFAQGLATRADTLEADIDRLLIELTEVRVATDRSAATVKLWLLLGLGPDGRAIADRTPAGSMHEPGPLAARARRRHDGPPGPRLHVD